MELKGNEEKENEGKMIKKSGREARWMKRWGKGRGGEEEREMKVKLKGEKGTGKRRKEIKRRKIKEGEKGR